MHAEDALGTDAASAAISWMGIVDVLLAKMASGRDQVLELGQHLALDVEVLEHRLDDQVGVAEAAVVDAPRRAACSAARAGDG